MGAQEKHEEVLTLLDRYIESVEDGDYEDAAEASSVLVEMDCSVCAQFGRHLTSLLVAHNTSVRDRASEEIADVAVREATHIRDGVVGQVADG